MIDYAEDTHTQGAIVFLDFRKAFDTVEWNFLFQTLSFFGFIPHFISLVKTMYHNATYCIINNGWKSQSFSPSRSLKQGCPMSSLLFLLVALIRSLIGQNPATARFLGNRYHRYFWSKSCAICKCPSAHNIAQTYVSKPIVLSTLCCLKRVCYC